MAPMTGGTIRAWVESRRAGCRLRLGSRRRQRLLWRLGRTESVAAGHRAHRALLQRAGSAIYRRYKWDPALVSPEARTLCARLSALEDYLSHVARQIVARPPGPAGRRPPRTPPRPAFQAQAVTG